MKHIASVLLIACLFAGGAQAAAQQDRPMQLYEQIQAMRDRVDPRVDPKHPDPAKLKQAEAILLQARALTERPDVKQLGQGNAFLAGRRSNVDFDLAGVLALQGRKQEAMDALDHLLSQYWFGGMVKYVQTKPQYAPLRGEPRFEAFLQTLRTNDRLWSDKAFASPLNALPDEARRLAGLSLFWSQAKYNFVYFDQVPNLDWDQSYLEFVPKVMAARTLHEYYDVLMHLAPLLHDAHTNVNPPASIENEF